MSDDGRVANLGSCPTLTSSEPFGAEIVVSGALLMATGALRLVRLSRRSAEILDQAPSSGTAPAQAAPTPASVPS